MNALLASGLDLMLIGMGTVFFFLTFLVLATSSMSALINKFAPDVAAHASSDEEKAINDELIQVIREAVRLHRQSRG